MLIRKPSQDEQVIAVAPGLCRSAALDLDTDRECGLGRNHRVGRPFTLGAGSLGSVAAAGDPAADSPGSLADAAGGESASDARGSLPHAPGRGVVPAPAAQSGASSAEVRGRPLAGT